MHQHLKKNLNQNSSYSHTNRCYVFPAITPKFSRIIIYHFLNIIAKPFCTFEIIELKKISIKKSFNAFDFTHHKAKRPLYFQQELQIELNRPLSSCLKIQRDSIHLECNLVSRLSCKMKIKHQRKFLSAFLILDIRRLKLL